MYKNLKQLMDDYTVGAVNAHNLEMVPSMITAAKDAGSPIIIQTSVATAEYVGMKNFVAVCKSMAQDLLVDVDLHLDHAKSFDAIKEAIDAGYSSVMFDGSALPNKENMERARRYTDPQQAIAFLNNVDVEALAVGVGTHHGQFKSKTELNWPLIEELHKEISKPMVIHGGTGVNEADYHRLTENGFRKFNVGTELLVGWTRKAKEMFGQTEVNNSLRNNIEPCNQVVYDIVKHKSGLFLNKDAEVPINA